MMSAYHQLHCLKKLHLAFIDLRISASQKPPSSASSLNSSSPLARELSEDHGPLQKRSEEMVKEVMNLKHAEHCFAYLRQAIMCAGNTTLEGTGSGEEGDTAGLGSCASVSDVGWGGRA
jgi:hypothetical protein